MRHPVRRLAALAALWLLMPQVGHAEISLQCADPLVTVIAADQAMGDRICAQAAASRPRLDACHLTQLRPVTISVPDTPLVAGLMGSFHLRATRI